MTHPTPIDRLPALGALMLVAALAACGGGSEYTTAAAPAPAPAPVAPSAISGSVAVGAPISNGKLRVLDATGAVVASDVPIDAQGRYAPITLTGPAPYRIEACGHAGGNYLCVYSVASGAGTANVTPLTTATVLLASGQSPDAVMSGTGTVLTDAGVAAAQDQLRTQLASVLTSAGITGSIDFVSGSLNAGSRAGYDGLLDAVGVSVGQDAHPFVQITPRLGSGNLYLEQGVSSGTVTAAPAASTLALGSLETLFADLSASLASAAACASETTGPARSLASTVRMSLGDGAPAQGPAQVAQGLCGFFAGQDGSPPMWGSRLMSPTLGRCDLSGAAPVCAVSFVLQTVEGDVQPVGNGMGAVLEGGRWKFLGNLLPIEIHASAKAQRDRRIDTEAVVDDYARAFAFEVEAVPGLACAKVSQRDASGSPVTVGYYKRHPGAVGQQRLSLWNKTGPNQGGASLDPLAGATRSADDTWITLPSGDEGDAVIRNFYRGGRTVTVALFGDEACSAPLALDGHGSFDVDVDGVPPVWAAMAALPWPDLDAASRAALRTLSVAAGASGSFHAAWSFARGPLGLDGATVCGDRAQCGKGNTGRIGEASLRASARESTIALTNAGPAVGADSSKMLALYGRNGEGVDLQSNYTSCPAVASAEGCH